MTAGSRSKVQGEGFQIIRQMCRAFIDMARTGRTLEDAFRLAFRNWAGSDESRRPGNTVLQAAKNWKPHIDSWANGALIGAYWGEEAIPERWRTSVVKADKILDLPMIWQGSWAGRGVGHAMYLIIRH